MILVTGGTGLVGNSVIRELNARGIPVRALCRKGFSHRCFTGLEVEVAEGDVRDLHSLQQAITGCTAAIHCAAMIHVGWTKLAESRRVNVEGTRNVATACIENQAKLIYVSTVDTLPAATSIAAPIDEAATGGIVKTPCAYVVSKREAENVVRESIKQRGLEAVIIQPGFMLAPYDWKPSSGRMLIQVSRAPFALAPAGGCSLCDARDVSFAIVNAIDHGHSGHAYILAGENVSYEELWTRMKRTANRSSYIKSSRRFLDVVALTLDKVSRVLPVPESDINGAAIAMGQLNHYYSSSKAEVELGYTRRPSSQTLSDAWDWLRNRKLAG